MVKEKTKKTIALVFRILLVIVLVFNISVILMQNTADYAFIEKLPLAMLPIYGGSMEPVLKSGDVILTSSTDYEKLEIGDIVVFVSSGDLVAHEIKDIRGDTLITRGTANDISDEPVSREDYKAKMICSVPFVGAMWRISSKPLNFVIFAVLLTLLIFGKEIFGFTYQKIAGKHDKDMGKEAE